MAVGVGQMTEASIGLPLSVYDITVEPLYCGHLGDWVECPVQRGALISGAHLC